MASLTARLVPCARSPLRRPVGTLCRPLCRRSLAVRVQPHVGTKAHATRGAAAGLVACLVVTTVRTMSCEPKPLDVRKSVKQLKHKMFDQIDANNDGWIEHDELVKIFDMIDTNHDGKITYSEFTDHLVRCGLSDRNCAAIVQVFNTLDTDSSGDISIEEWTRYFGGGEQLARYAGRVAQALLVKGRLLAYTSDLGESVRPVMPLWFVNCCYGLTFLYAGIGVTYETANAYMEGLQNEMVLRACLHAATFQTLASIALPAVIIHQVVHVAQRQAHRLPAGPVAKFVPSLLGLCCIPLLPHVDEPVEHVVDASFDFLWPRLKEPHPVFVAGEN
eukprot:CAMPEP_0177232030 /NCGR_PEP_ID=MMETSP0367-20130122/43090_1 /TAXON_ID=447022 ORGANISM="Scrippsiella hangoei-like, Strain SHHI-4" /NCGR_SAMPLE_ID=MMETSP0367 /ASSEMBLY_ACC=CAM_ASM_000362 /LENGTH=331 /DNA_ID=CAMNT_0018682619 /DNA_START=26 /DNA_END=1021 /DNA_ORIENTATION=+